MAKQKSSANRRDAKLPASWLDDDGDTPVIEEYARRLDTFIEAMADGQIEEHELEAQETRLVRLMKEIEPQLEPALHAKITELLCELTAYDLMQFMRSLHAARPKREFRG
jgi:hypothetical protein